jgi:transposase
MRYAGKQHWSKISADLKKVYTAPTVTAAEVAFEDFAAVWRPRFPAMVAMWERSWNEFVPFLSFPPEVRRLIYTTNGIESLNARFRAAVRRRGHFPTEQATMKIRYLPVIERRPSRANPTGRIPGWKNILNILAVTYPDRITIHQAGTRAHKVPDSPDSPVPCGSWFYRRQIMSRGRGELTDRAWARIEPLLPPQGGQRGGQWRDHRQVINAILWRLWTRAPWRDLPERCRPRKTAHERLRLWTADGTWERIMAEAVTEDDSIAEVESVISIDSSNVRAHQHAAGVGQEGCSGAVEVLAIDGEARWGDPAAD